MANPEPLPLLKRPQIALLLSVNEGSIARWEREGLPVSQPGSGGKASLYDAKAVVAWRLERERAKYASGGVSVDDARARKDMSLAELNARKLATIDGELIPRTEFERVLGPVVDAIKKRLLAGPRAWAPRIAALLPGAQSALTATIERLLVADVREMLTELAGIRASNTAGASPRRK